MKKTETVQFTVTPEWKEKWRAAHAAQGTNGSEIARLLMDAYLDAIESGHHPVPPFVIGERKKKAQ